MMPSANGKNGSTGRVGRFAEGVWALGCVGALGAGIWISACERSSPPPAVAKAPTVAAGSAKPGAAIPAAAVPAAEASQPMGGDAPVSAGPMGWQTVYAAQGSGP